ncbi:MAG: hypothetical protein F9K16_12375 [Thermoanaerobaculia bacterium]|nr:MAG: hypothetical protein F9K16_12375 [Thermoanaerobaculia bacterium]MBZ0103673.1 VCBS repeat-containing protein [Thermoanaerobaculia bacterium]
MKRHPKRSPGRRLPSTTLVLFVAAAAVAPAQVWEVDDRFLSVGLPDFQHGAAIAVADHDGDGIDDLVVGAPGSNGSGAQAGAFAFYLGGEARTMDIQAWFLGEPGDRLGTAVVAGDFDADGTPDIAVGAPGYDVEIGAPPAVADAGGVWVYEWIDGSPTPGFRRFIAQNDSGDGVPEVQDLFGHALAVGDFDHDGFADLAIGVPFEDAGATADVGVVHVFYGSATGLLNEGSQTWRAGAGGVLGTPAAGDRFGWSLAAGDFDGDDFDDLAIGAPQRDVGAENNAGQVHVLYGSAAGITATGNQLLDDDDFGSTAGAGERFATALAAGQFDQTRIACIVACEDDLAIGVPFEVVLGVPAAGKAVVAYGSPTGLGGTGATTLTRLSAQQLPANGDAFGFSLAAGHLDRSPAGVLFNFADLAVGSLNEDVEGVSEAGATYLFFGSSAGVGGGALSWQRVVARNGLGIGPPETFDQFGKALAIGDFDGDGWGDLAAGAPFDDHETIDDAGGVQLLYGALFADGFEGGTTGGWESSGAAP